MIELHHLAKRYGALQAVQDLSLQLHPGEILGFLGPNGAGKSTTMKMATGFVTPDSGEVRIHGIHVQQDPIAAQRLIGYLPEGAPSYGDMETEQFLRFIAEVRGFVSQEIDEVVHEAMHKLDLVAVRHQRIETLSKGFKRRVGLAQAILHDPKVLILDEPTDGLDPNQKHQVRELIRGLSKDKIVIISTHILEEVTAVCTRVVIMADGRLVEDCTPDELQRRSSLHGAVSLDFVDAPPAEVVTSLAAIPGVGRVEQAGFTCVCYPDSEQPLFEAIRAYCDQAGVTPKHMYQERGQLDDVFRALTEGAAT